MQKKIKHNRYKTKLDNILVNLINIPCAFTVQFLQFSDSSTG